MPSRALLVVAIGDSFITSRAHCTATMETQASTRLMAFNVERSGFFILPVMTMP